MHHEFPILINITLALMAAFMGGLLARRLKLPSMVGYMLAGVAIGPFTPGFSGDLSTIQQLAELGVTFLLFDVGLYSQIYHSSDTASVHVGALCLSREEDWRRS